MEKIEALKKVTLSLEAGEGKREFEFIFGLGSRGLTPFEYQLADKAEGDELTIPLKREDIPQIFQHLLVPPLNIPNDLDAFDLRVKVIKVVPAGQREVIKALSEVARCGDHCCGH